MKRRHIPYEEKLAAVRKYLEGEHSMREIAHDMGVHHSSVEKWVLICKMFGEEGLQRKYKYDKHDEKFKKKMVKKYLDGEYSLSEICKQHGIRSTSKLHSWVRKYRVDLSE